jgi:hypothetical protein
MPSGANLGWNMKADNGTVYVAPHWVDVPATSEPYLYRQGSFMKIQYANWIVGNPDPTATYTVKATGPKFKTTDPDPLEFPVTAATLNGNVLRTSSSLVATVPFPANEVAYYDPAVNPLTLTWEVSVNGGPFQAGGVSTNPIYVCLKGPNTNGRPLLLRTTVHLACAGLGVFDPATNADEAFANTWQLMKGRDVNKFVGDVQNAPLYYYRDATTFAQNPEKHAAYLLKDVNQTGECTCWASLMQDACALNGALAVKARATCNTILFPDYTRFLINNWTFNASTNPDLPIPPNGPWWWFATAIPGNNSLGEMVPPPDRNNPAIFGDLTNAIGSPGQNSPTPSEKLFKFHEFLKYTINGSSKYYDPSYGLEYMDNVDFHNQAIAGYATNPNLAMLPGFARFAVQKPNDGNGNPRVIIQITT